MGRKKRPTNQNRQAQIQSYDMEDYDTIVQSDSHTTL